MNRHYRGWSISVISPLLAAVSYTHLYVVIAAIQQLCAFLLQAIETILSIFTLFIRVMIPVVLFASTFIATTKVSELIPAMYSLKIPPDSYTHLDVYKRQGTGAFGFPLAAG